MMSYCILLPSIYGTPLGCTVTSAELRAPLGPGLCRVLHLPAPEDSACSEYSTFTTHPYKLLGTLFPQLLALEALEPLKSNYLLL